MSYLVLARKYRPASFGEVIGQDHITEILTKALPAGRVAHAYLFCGPRGIGKTSCARILAKSLNCQKGPTVQPCGECPACREIGQGTSFDVLEIDGASNRGIDEIRTIRENVKFAPTNGRYKIYIIDEVHMLTTEAFNALLKTLEEPPEHTKFIFATTESYKLPPTIISRCQRFDFKRIPMKVMVDRLTQISQLEALRVDTEALYKIAKAAQGSFRDALSILDQLGALNDRSVNTGDVDSMLGLVDTEMLFELVEALAARNCSQALKTFSAILDKGKDIKQLGRDLVEHYRNLMIVKVGGKSLGRLIEHPLQVKEQFLAQSEKFNIDEILTAIDVLVEAQEMSRVMESLTIPLEIAFAKLTTLPKGKPAAAATFIEPPASPPMSKPVSVAPVPAAKPLPAVPKVQPAAEVRTTASVTPQTFSKPTAVAIAPAQDTAPGLAIDDVKRHWDALTFAVSRKKMSLATYLQEGFPYAVEGNTLVIGFPKEFSFHKETLESKDYAPLIEQTFTEILGTFVRLNYRLVEMTASPQEAEDPMIKTALETFNGKIVSRWHNDQAPAPSAP